MRKTVAASRRHKNLNSNNAYPAKSAKITHADLCLFAR
jgi:hypothetical protein